MTTTIKFICIFSSVFVICVYGWLHNYVRNMCYYYMEARRPVDATLHRVLLLPTNRKENITEDLCLSSECLDSGHSRSTCLAYIYFCIVVL